MWNSTVVQFTDNNVVTAHLTGYTISHQRSTFLPYFLLFAAVERSSNEICHIKWIFWMGLSVEGIGTFIFQKKKKNDFKEIVLIVIRISLYDNWYCVFVMINSILQKFWHCTRCGTWYTVHIKNGIRWDNFNKYENKSNSSV